MCGFFAALDKVVLQLHQLLGRRMKRALQKDPALNAAFQSVSSTAATPAIPSMVCK